MFYLAMFVSFVSVFRMQLVDCVLVLEFVLVLVSTSCVCTCMMTRSKDDSEKDDDDDEYLGYQRNGYVHVQYNIT